MQKREILLIEDEAVIREIMQTNICWEQFGFHLTTADSYLPAIDSILDTLKPDAILLDIGEPEDAVLPPYLAVRSPESILAVACYEDSVPGDTAGFGWRISKPLTPQVIYNFLGQLADYFNHKRI